MACGWLPGKGLPSTGILLRRSKPAGIYLFTLTFLPSLLVSLNPEVLRLLTRGIPVSEWVHIRSHQVTGVLLTRSRQCRIRMSRTHRRNVWVCGPRVCQKRASTSQRRYSGWRSLSTRSGPAETGRIIPRCENLPKGIYLVPQACSAGKVLYRLSIRLHVCFVLVSPVFCFWWSWCPRLPCS